MSAFSNYLEQKVLEYTLRGGNLPKPTTIYLALFTSDPTDAGTGTEVSDSAYARQDCADGGAIASGWTAPVVDGIGHSVNNAKEIEFPAFALAVGEVTHFALYDAATSGNLLYHGAFDTPKDLGKGDIASIAPGTVTVALE